MPIQVELTKTELPIVLHGWTLRDLDAMAEPIAHLLLGHTAYIRKVLTGSSTRPPGYTDADVDKAIDKLRFEDVKADDNRVIHRDGWLFQFVSWLMSMKEYPNALVKAPQPRPADKGFDGLIILMDASKIECVVICEDKATENPRSTITQDVWPEFACHEDGDRDSELTAEATSMLYQRHGLDPDELTRFSKWFGEKRYRASVTTSKKNLSPLAHTFKGYEDVVKGADNRRRYANLFEHDDMRIFFNQLSERIVAILERQRPNNLSQK